MGSFSAWHWVIVLLAIGVPAWFIIQTLKNRRKTPDAQISGISGWLALLAFGLCMGLLRNVVEFLKSWPDVAAGWQANPAARGPLAIVVVLTVAFLIANIWAIVALFRKQRTLRLAYMTLWLLAAIVPFSVLTMLSVPGVTLEMILPAEEIGRTVGTLVLMGLWFWYLSVSQRVRNTMVN